MILILLGLPLLAVGLYYLSYTFEVQAVQAIFFSEIVIGFIWLGLALHLHLVIAEPVRQSRFSFLLKLLTGAAAASLAAYLLFALPFIRIADGRLVLPQYGTAYFFSLFILAIMLYSSWRLEQFWRLLNEVRRWEYKFLVVGCFLVCGALSWSCSYRLAYLIVFPYHLRLLAILLTCGWVMISYAVLHHRLLNRKVFVSRKIIYASVVPSLLAAYLLGFGIVSLIMRAFDLEMSFVLKWTILVFGFVAVGLFIFSGRIRRRVHFFISTHFYNNKYEYRDEWLALSQQIHGAPNETGIVKALGDVLQKSLYTSEIYIWIEQSDSSKAYRMAYSSRVLHPDIGLTDINADNRLVSYLNTHPYFHHDEQEPDQQWREVANQLSEQNFPLEITLFSSISIGEQQIGMIGLGPEYTGGTYGQDDFDLLSALGSQAASALLAARMAEKLAVEREQQAWNRLSVFVLHDIKNAATMLSLLQENAPEHIHETEFQQDMLDLVDDALRRMKRVEQRLSVLKDEVEPNIQELDLMFFLRECSVKLKKKLSSTEIIIDGPPGISLHTDSEILASILENLLLNSYEARSDGLIVRIRCYRDDAGRIAVEVTDNGPGIVEELLPEVLFEAFKTSKKEGSGIGLWQVKKGVVRLGGTISAKNAPGEGATFTITLPVISGVG